MDFELINPNGVHEPTGYSHAAKVGNILYISGQVAVAPDGQLVGKGDIEAQARQVFANLLAVLRDQGAELDRIFKMTTLITHPSYLEPFRAARNEVLSAPFPANTLHVVQALAGPDWLIEVEAIALLD
jgi:enamine deaminase RidA (YjgF/YER057c/UK114 family)